MTPVSIMDKGIGLKGWMHDRKIVIDEREYTKKITKESAECSSCGVRKKEFWSAWSDLLCINCMLQKIQEAEFVIRK